VLKDKAGILVDEQFGGVILPDAAAQGYATASPAEKSGGEFDFDYGEDFAKHVEAFSPSARWLLQSGRRSALIRRQSARLKRLSEYSTARGAAGSCSSCSRRRKRRSWNSHGGQEDL
jgi:5-dehydro-2-deoxygluconokinase